MIKNNTKEEETITPASVMMKHLPIEKTKLAVLMKRLILLVSSLPAEQFKKLCVKGHAITTAKVIPIDLVKDTMHGHLVSKPFEYFLFCGDTITKDPAFIAAMCGSGCGIMDIVLVATIRHKKCVSTEWRIMKLTMSPKNAYNLMNWLEDPRKKSRKSFKKACGGKDSNIREALMRNNGHDLNRILRDMEIQEIHRKVEENNDDPTTPEDVVNTTLPMELFPEGNKEASREYLALRNSCLKVVMSVYHNSMCNKMTDEELHLIIIDVIGSYHQMAINKVFDGDADLFYAKMQTCAAWKKLSKQNIEHYKHQKKLEKVVQKCLRKCASCGSDADGNLRKCAKCQNVYYCDAICQRLGWTQGGHSLVCKQKEIKN